MLKLSLKPGEYITLGDNIKIIFSLIQNWIHYRQN